LEKLKKTKRSIKERERRKSNAFFKGRGGTGDVEGKAKKREGDTSMNKPKILLHSRKYLNITRRV